LRAALVVDPTKDWSLLLLLYLYILLRTLWLLMNLLVLQSLLPQLEVFAAVWLSEFCFEF
jgi:hypothetical protein